MPTLRLFVGGHRVSRRDLRPCSDIPDHEARDLYSLTAWLLALTGHPMDLIAPPGGGRAPGWNAGLFVAARDDRNPRSSAVKA